LGCKSTNHVDEEITRPSVFERGEIRVAIENSSSSYFVFRGNPMGYHYDLLALFAQRYGLTVHLIVCKTPGEAMLLLQNDLCDLIAMNMTITGDRTKQALFTVPLRKSYQVLVQRKPDNWRRMYTAEAIEKSLIREPIHLAGKTITVSEGSSYITRLQNIMNEIGDTIYIQTEPVNEEELFERVASGEIDYTVCDDNDALLNGRNYPDIDSRTPISFKQNVAWAVHPHDTTLRDSLNFFLEDLKKSSGSAILFEKYYRYPPAKSSHHSQGRDAGVTPWDEEIQRASEQYGLDWVLVASLIYQESRFDPYATSSKGAFGLMQMIPETMASFGVDTLSSIEEHIIVGIRYLSYLNNQFSVSVPDSAERVKFMLAAYNSGPGHIIDAQKLAQKTNRSPALWSDVSVCLIEKCNPEVYRNDEDIKYGYCRGEAVVSYVDEILDRYKHYKIIFSI
jgi:membrane-bound lytic murein transglycosylase F